MKISLFLLFIISNITYANISNSDFNFTTWVNKSGSFKTIINTSYPSSDSLEDIVRLMVLTPSLQAHYNKEINSFTSSRDMTKLVKRKGVHHFSVVTRAKKFGVSARIDSSCTLSVQSNKISNVCNVTNSKAGLIRPIIPKGRTEVTCTGATNQTKKCTITLTGQTRNFYFGVVNRSASRLAVSGVQAALETFFKAYFYKRNFGVTFGYSNQAHFSKNISSLWSAMMKYAPRQKELTSNVKAYSTNNGHVVSTY